MVEIKNDKLTVQVAPVFHASSARFLEILKNQ
jgi:hypothetical protein